MRRCYIKKGDISTSRATVTQGIEGMRHHGMTLAFLGAEVNCPQCQSIGRIVASGPRYQHTWMRKRPALHGDLAVCKCKPTPRLIASQDSMFETYEAADLAKMGFAPNGSALPRPAPVGTVQFAADAEDAPEPSTAPKEHAAPDCSYLDGTKARIDAPASFYATKHEVQLSPGRVAGENSREYDASIGGKTVPIFTSTQAPPSGTALATPKQLAEAMGTLPDQHLANVGRVTAQSAPNSKDAYWQEVYRDPKFLSAATANLEQGVNFYPWRGWSGAIDQRYINSTMLHETGHQVSQSLWTEDPELKEAYQSAVNQDGQAPSQYARNNVIEDFAESSNMYWSSKGTPCEAEGRKRYPSRYRYFDSIST